MGRFEVLRLRVKKRQDLRVVDEQIDVMAFAVFDLEHQRRAPTKCPTVNDQSLAVTLVDDRHGDIEQFGPAAGSWIVQRKG